MNKKVILSSILVLAMCVTLISGATFALFTSETKTDISVTSGDVEIYASIENVAVHSPKLIDMDGNVKDNENIADTVNNVFANGGSASVNGAKLTLDKMTPGDKVTFQIVVANSSNVAAKYRYVIRTLNDTGLFDGLDVRIDKVSYDGTTRYSDWNDLPVSTKEFVVDCSVELPAGAGNTYKAKSCEIVFAVDAVQGNTATTNNVAKIGDTEYASLESALAAVQEGETVEILRAGTYEPFKLAKKGVTIKGINTGDRTTSTVIKNTATKNIQAYADGITLENLYIDTTEVQSIGWMNSGAIDPYISPNNGIVAKDLTVKGCYIVGNKADRVMMYCQTGLTFTENTVVDFAKGIVVQHDGGAAGAFIVDGNKFINVAKMIDAYWGAAVSGTYDGVATITDNTVVGESLMIVWDYAQFVNKVTAFSDLTISGNNGDIVYNLRNFDYYVDTPATVTSGTGNQKVVYQSTVAFDIPTADRANYEIQTIDGSEWTEALCGENNTLTKTVGDKPAVYNIATGKYILLDKTTGIKYYFEVSAPDAATVGQQVITLDTVSLFTAEDLFKFAENVNVKGISYSGKTVLLMNNIDLENAAWTPIGQTGGVCFKGTFDGQDNTIYNLNIDTSNDPVQLASESPATGMFGWLEGTVKNLNIDGASVKGVRRVGTIAGYVQFGKIVNCHVTDADILCTHVGEGSDNITCGDKAGGIAGFLTSNEGAEISGCSVSDTRIVAGRDAGAIVGCAYPSTRPNCVDGCTVAADVTVTAEDNGCKGGNITTNQIGRPDGR